MDILKNAFEKLKGINRRRLVKFIAVIMMIAFLSFLIERFGFGWGLNSLDESEKGISVVQKSDIVADGFFLDDNGVFVSQQESATLEIETGGKFLNNIELKLGDNPKYSILVEYIDSKSGQEIILKKGLHRSLAKSKTNFLDFLVFNIGDSPEKITIKSLALQTSINEIRIDNNYYFNEYRFLFVAAILTLILAATVLRKRVGENPEYLFFAIALICGSLIAFSETRSFVSWDEAIHHGRADNKSFEKLIKKDVKDIYSQKTSVPYSYSIKEQSAIDGYFNARQKKENSGGSKKKKLDFKDFYAEIAYYPSGLAMALGRLMQLPYHLIFVFGRWINVLVYALIVFLAIRKLKSGKMIMAVIALFPTALFLAANYGYDSWLIAFTMLGFAYLFSELQQPEKKIGVRDMAIMIGSFVVGLAPKAIYFPIMFLLFLLPSKKFASLAQYKKFILASVISILFVVGSFVLPFVISGDGGDDRRGGADVNSAEQVNFILSEPLVYSKILLNFIKDYINPLNAGGFVTSFAYLGSINGFWLLLGIVLAVSLFDKNKFDRKTSTFKIIISIVAVYLMTIVLISTALYVAFTVVRSETIAGVQPRYLLPIIFPLLFVIGISRIRNPIKKNIFNLIIFLTVALVLLKGIWELIVRHHY